VGSELECFTVVLGQRLINWGRCSRTLLFSCGCGPLRSRNEVERWREAKIEGRGGIKPQRRWIVQASLDNAPEFKLL
jgi:hypothetical protein